MRRVYNLEADDLDKFGGQITLERWYGPDGVRLLLVDPGHFGGGERRANIVMSPNEAKRLARQLVAMTERER